MSITEDLKYDAPPIFLEKEDTEKFMVWAFKTGTSDITIQSGERIMLDYQGRKYFPTERVLNNEEVQNILQHMSNRPDAISTINQMKPLDFAYAASPTREVVYRFRVNATACDDNGNNGIQITCRTIAPIPPKLESMNVEDVIMKNMTPKQGLVMVTGATGSGKSTLLAGIIRYMLEDPDGNRKILTYEDPIEYVYKLVKKPSSTIAQTEIHRHLLSFQLGAITTMRRKPEVILMGEMRDAETVQETLNISVSGHAVLTTLHANGFVDTIRRMVGMFPDGEKSSKMIDIISALRLTIGQQLLPKVGGGRIPIREIVAFNDTIVEQLLDPKVGIDRLIMTSKDVLREHGQSFTQDALKKFNQGLISRDTFIKVARAAQASEEEAIRMTERRGRHVDVEAENVPSEESQKKQKEDTLENLFADIKNSGENINE